MAASWRYGEAQHPFFRVQKTASSSLTNQKSPLSLPLGSALHCCRKNHRRRVKHHPYGSTSFFSVFPLPFSLVAAARPHFPLGHSIKNHRICTASISSTKLESIKKSF
ncbi:hypothetical protein PIB30_061340 [Stylosanthes scabra]|uniref:Uncharacterized protein n=1 Tax=Stylosanthes scabra TaxID=79078 RepID=A0ABU6YJ06_9FABA|nr:hypothetical protein [Stylosanthes scabra]